MKIPLVLFLNILSLYVVALPPSTKMIKYIGANRSNTAFAPIYSELQNAHNDNPNRSYYSNEGELAHDQAIFHFDELGTLDRITFKEKMPFGISASTHRFWAKLKLWFYRVDAKTGETPKGYIVQLLYDHKNKVDEMVVRVIPELRTARLKGSYESKGFRFNDYASYEKFFHYEKGTSFVFLRKEDGQCIDGDCVAFGTMKWNATDVTPEVVFKGKFGQGKPKQGDLEFEIDEFGQVTIRDAWINRDGFPEGAFDMALKGHEDAKVTYYDGNIRSVRNLPLKFYYKGPTIYSGQVNLGVYPEVNKTSVSTFEFDSLTAKVRYIDPYTFEGTLDFHNDILFNGRMSSNFNLHGHGVMNDKRYGGTLIGQFYEDVPIQGTWSCSNGSTRSGLFDTKTGFNGPVTTTYETLFSTYTLQGDFVNHAPNGTHIMTEDRTEKQIGRALYQNGKLLSGTDFYSMNANSFEELKQEDEWLLGEFYKIVDIAIAEYSKGYSVDHLTFTYESPDIYETNYKDVEKSKNVQFVVYDPFSSASSYYLKSSSTSYTASATYPIIHLNVDPENPGYFIGDASIKTGNLERLQFDLKANGAKKSKYVAELFLLY